MPSSAFPRQYAISELYTYCLFCLTAIAPRVDLVAWKAMEDVAFALVAERKKKRPAVQSGRY